MLIKYSEIAKFKSLYDRYLFLENRLQAYDLTPRFLTKVDNQ